MNPVLKRTLCGLTVGAAVIAFFLYCPLKVVPIVLLAFSTLTQLEFYQMVRKYEPMTGLGLFAGVAWIIASAAFPGPIGFTGTLVGLGVFAVPFVFLLAVVAMFRSECKRPIGSVSATVFGFFYVPFLMSFFLRLIQLAPDPGTCFAMPDVRTGFYTLLAVIALAKFSDTGGFAFGVSFGKHKMCPAISPNKSWEGLVGSMVFASATLSVFLLLSNHFGWSEHCMLWKYLSWPLVVPLGILFAVVGTAGDLIESRFKRECEVKDSATFMPAGMGGFLDMVDSVLFLPAFVYPIELYLYWVNV